MKLLLFNLYITVECFNEHSWLLPNAMTPHAAHDTHDAWGASTLLLALGVNNIPILLNMWPFMILVCQGLLLIAIPLVRGQCETFAGSPAVSFLFVFEMRSSDREVLVWLIWHLSNEVCSSFYGPTKQIYIAQGSSQNLLAVNQAGNADLLRFVSDASCR